MSAQIVFDVDTLKNPISLVQPPTLDGYTVHQKFLARVYALGNQVPEIKTFLQSIDFYSVIPPLKIRKLKENIDDFFNKVNSAGLTEHLVEPTARRKIREQYTSRMLNDRGVFEAFLYSQALEQEVNEGMTIDISKVDIKIREEKNDAWKLHINIDMGRNSKNTQEKVDIAYNILLEKAKQNGIKNLKLVAPFENIDDMWGREISIYLKFQSSTEDTEKIRLFILEVEEKFIAERIIATPENKRDEANKVVSGSQYFYFRNEYANNPRKYFSAENAKTLSSFINTHHAELFEYYNANDNEKAEKLQALASLVTLQEKAKLYEIVSCNPSLARTAFFERDFKNFLQKNISSSLQDFLKPPPASAHNPFKLTDNFQLESLNLTLLLQARELARHQAELERIARQTVLPAVGPELQSPLTPRPGTPSLPRSRSRSPQAPRLPTDTDPLSPDDNRGRSRSRSRSRH